MIISISAYISNPHFSYSNKTSYKQFAIFHKNKLEPVFGALLDSAYILLLKREFFNKNLEFKVCLNDGVNYQRILEAVRGPSFAWGFMI